MCLQCHTLEFLFPTPYFRICVPTSYLDFVSPMSYFRICVANVLFLSLCFQRLNFEFVFPASYFFLTSYFWICVSSVLVTIYVWNVLLRICVSKPWLGFVFPTSYLAFVFPSSYLGICVSIVMCFGRMDKNTLLEMVLAFPKIWLVVSWSWRIFEGSTDLSDVNPPTQVFNLGLKWLSHHLFWKRVIFVFAWKCIFWLIF